VHGTLVCAVTESDESEDAVALGAQLSARLGLRLVLAHAVDGVAALGQRRDGAERRLRELAEQHGVAGTADRRVAVGDPAALVGRIAAEEAADVIVVGARPRRWRRRSPGSRLAHELKTETPVPVLLAPPRAWRRRA